MISAEELTKGFPEGLNADEKDSVDVVLKDYGDRAPYDLSEQAHFEESWKQARGDLPEEAPCQNVITVESMGKYYGSLLYE